ncbi:uncharacterized protein [Watersipora subatra]|uniref:uncharacterized protein n=1 Tax=Watersipora subatra TaxID=2589382 RepID=UPI00355BB673
MGQALGIEAFALHRNVETNEVLANNQIFIKIKVARGPCRKQLVISSEESQKDQLPEKANTGQNGPMKTENVPLLEDGWHQTSAKSDPNQQTSAESGMPSDQAAQSKYSAENALKTTLPEPKDESPVENRTPATDENLEPGQPLADQDSSGTAETLKKSPATIPSSASNDTPASDEPPTTAVTDGNPVTEDPPATATTDDNPVTEESPATDASPVASDAPAPKEPHAAAATNETPASEDPPATAATDDNPVIEESPATDASPVANDTPVV